MNSPAFLLALAPAASAVATRTVAAAKSTGESFVSILSNMLDDPAAKVSATSTALKPTLAEAMQSLAEQLRVWLTEHGAGDDYSINYYQAADGESQLDVQGASAGEVKQLLAADTDWMAKLQQLASSMQAKSAQLNRDFVPNSVTIEIDQHDAKAF